MARTMRAPSPRRRSSAAIGTPAATDSTSFRESMAGATVVSSLWKACGFTESTTISASRAAARLSVATRIPKACSSSASSPAAHGGGDALRRGARAQQPADDGRRHVAAAQEGDALVDHFSSPSGAGAGGGAVGTAGNPWAMRCAAERTALGQRRIPRAQWRKRIADHVFWKGSACSASTLVESGIDGWRTTLDRISSARR